jgi:hypothetical protein
MYGMPWGAYVCSVLNTHRLASQRLQDLEKKT